MMAESDAFAREFPKRRRVALGDEVGTHPVPDEDDDVSVVRRGFGFAKDGRGKEAGEEGEEARWGE